MMSVMCNIPDRLDIIKPDLDRIVTKIVDNHDPIRIILFGSYARGTTGKHSDIDLLVVMDNGKKEGAGARIINTLAFVSDIPQDIVVTAPDDIERIGDDTGYVIYYALKDGITLYER